MRGTLKRSSTEPVLRAEPWLLAHEVGVAAASPSPNPGSLACFQFCRVSTGGRCDRSRHLLLVYLSHMVVQSFQKALGESQIAF